MLLICWLTFCAQAQFVTVYPLDARYEFGGKVAFGSGTYNPSARSLVIGGDVQFRAGFE